MKCNQKIRLAIFRSFLLLCVYSLHLVFFQAAMASSETGTAKYFKTYLSHKANHNKGKPSPAGFYIKFIKHANSGERPTLSMLHDVAGSLFHVHLAVPVKEIPPVSTWALYSHFPDDAFKLYQRIRVFLI